MNWLKKRQGKLSMGELFFVFLLIVFALALTPTIADSVATATGNNNASESNITGASADIINLVPIVWVFIVIGIGAAAVIEMFEGLG